MARFRWMLGVALALALVGTGLSGGLPAGAAPAAQVTVGNGSVVGLQGTPHLFVGDEQGVLHWAGDTRALTGRFVSWSSRTDVTLDTLKSLRRGDPYLSAGLVKLGDPIYLVKWESGESSPTLLHIQSIADVELFGIDSSNYGSFVLDKSAWEQRFGMSTDTLARGELTAAVGATATPTPVGTATPQTTMTAALVDVVRTAANVYKTTVQVKGATPRSTIYVSLRGEEYNCSPSGCTTDADTRAASYDKVNIGQADSSGNLTWTDQHSAYKQYTYTFADEYGRSASIALTDDQERKLEIAS